MSSPQEPYCHPCVCPAVQCPGTGGACAVEEFVSQIMSNDVYRTIITSLFTLATAWLGKFSYQKFALWKDSRQFAPQPLSRTRVIPLQ